ncbi:MAG: extracellular solute-binding protein [Rhodospirillales bacterium]|jgi:multiple sugar transport system substrate-binding protein|nr:extracellular solute-binding protein [Rhodospirillales bacterium]
MQQTVIRGIAWAHRRAVDPLIAASTAYEETRNDLRIEWEARPLHGFEFTPVAELARAYDLIVLDHPFMGEAAESRCLLPLDRTLPGLADGDFIGPSLATYRYRGETWAVPVDAACQTATFRPDLLERLGGRVPGTLPEVLALGEAAHAEGLRLAIALKGVHALMTLLTLCAALGRPCGERPGQPFADPDTARHAVDWICAILEHCPAEALDWNSIALHEAMVARDDLVYCPAVYCYLTYAEADMRRPLRFAGLPATAAGGEPRGSTIGGAGIAVSASTQARDAALGFLRFLAGQGAQRLFAEHHGQPARVEGWHDERIDNRFGGAFSAVRRTMELSWIRPRWPGYLGLQAQGGALIEAHLRGEIGKRDAIDRLNRAAAAARQSGGA